MTDKKGIDTDLVREAAGCTQHILWEVGRFQSQLGFAPGVDAVNDIFRHDLFKLAQSLEEVAFKLRDAAQRSSERGFR